MKLNQKIIGDCGSITLELNRNLPHLELGRLVNILSSVVNGEEIVLTSPGKEDITTYPTEYRITIKSFNPDNKINLIKTVRSVLSCGLKDAKDMVEGKLDCPWLNEYSHLKFAKILKDEGFCEFSIKERIER